MGSRRSRPGRTQTRTVWRGSRIDHVLVLFLETNAAQACGGHDGLPCTDHRLRLRHWWCLSSRESRGASGGASPGSTGRASRGARGAASGGAGWDSTRQIIRPSLAAASLSDTHQLLPDRAHTQSGQMPIWDRRPGLGKLPFPETRPHRRKVRALRSERDIGGPANSKRLATMLEMQ
jgi:hypothetical protein